MTAHQLKPRPFVSPEEHRRRREQARAAKIAKRKAAPAQLVPLPDYASLRYDYAAIDAAHRQAVMDAALEIRGRQKRMALDAIAIGVQLRHVRALMPDRFVEWAKQEFGYRRQWAYETINVADKLESCPIIGQLSDTTARMIAGPTVPDTVIAAVVEATRLKGRTLMVSEVAAIKRRIMSPSKTVKKLTGAVATPVDANTDAIEAEYSVTYGTGVPEPMTFDAWLAACPADLTLREEVAFWAFVKKRALRVMGAHPGLYIAVDSVMSPLRSLIHAIEKMTSKEPL